MKELLEIIRVARQTNTAMALATVVQTAGSSYRKAGARMLISFEGGTVGCISGGCLDQDVVLRALDVIKNKKTSLLSYDTSSDQDVVMGAGLGCKGIVDILVEYLPPKDPLAASDGGFLGFLEKLIDRRCLAAVATVIETTGTIGLTLGDRVVMDDFGYIGTYMAESDLADVLINCAQSTLSGFRPGIIGYESSNGSARIFVETILPQTKLVIMGAGHDAIPLARMAHELGYRVSIADTRSAYATRERFPFAAETTVARPEEGCPDQLFDAQSAAVIMSHHYLTDQGWLKCLLPLGLPYVGLMGPRQRAEQMLAELRQDGFEIEEQGLESLYNPIGLDIGAATPEQIALSILAEIQAVVTGHEGGKLRQKKGAFAVPPSPSETPRFQLPQEAGPCGVLA